MLFRTAKLLFSVILIGFSIGVIGEQIDSAWNGDVPIRNAFSATAPALAVLDGEIYLIHRSRQTTEMYWATSFGDNVWTESKKVVSSLNVPLTTSLQPAAVAFNGEIFLVYREVDTTRLRIAQMQDGQWQDDRLIEVAEGYLMTDKSPAVAVHNDRLHVAYKSSTTSDLHIAWMTADGVWEEAPIMVHDGGTPLTDSAPALASFRGKLYVAYKAFDGHALYWAWFDGTGWYGDEILGFETPDCDDFAASARGATLVAQGNDRLWLPFNDTDIPWLCHLWFDGDLWYPADRVGETLMTLTRPAAVSVDGHIYATYKGWGTNQLFWIWR